MGDAGGGEQMGYRSCMGRGRMNSARGAVRLSFQVTEANADWRHLLLVAFICIHLFRRDTSLFQLEHETAPTLR